MSRLIDTGMQQLADIILHMGELAYETVSSALNGYVNGREAYAPVENTSATLVDMADEAEDKAFELIARFQPVASDLRTLKSYMKIAYDFERFGRYALDVSQVQKKLDGLGECEDWINTSIKKMSEKVLSMVHTCVDSLKRHDARLALTLSETENQVDEMYFTYLDRLVEKAPATNRCTISSVLVVRYLERIADHATYVGESIIYFATGKKVTLR
jgi:phosphate transport system protein